MSDFRTNKKTDDFYGRHLPEPAQPVGYASLYDTYSLKLPLPYRLAAIAQRHSPVSTSEWQLLTPRHAPENTLLGQLEFALKWEGIELGVLSALFKSISDQEVKTIIQSAPTGAYTRRIWYLYELLTGRQLDVPDPGKVRAVPIVDPEKQFAIEEGTLSTRHKVLDNLPGTRYFCPMVRKTPSLKRFVTRKLNEQAMEIVGRIHPDVITRTAACLLLGDSRSSFQIEGERPTPQRMQRWARVIGEAGSRRVTVHELERLQKILIGDDRLVRLGLRKEGGFIGVHDRRSREPIPEHISAKPQDLQSLMQGLMDFDQRSVKGGIDPVIAAAMIAFGFVYIHPFEDGNGRLHRWLIHHVLASMGYTPKGVVFPISAAILRDLQAYKGVLEFYSSPLLDFIEWEVTADMNVSVKNDTADYYRYFDATVHAEFLYGCVEKTIQQDIPDEVAYLQAYDAFCKAIQEIIDIPSTKVDLLHHFLEQGSGRLSNRAKKKEFSVLAEDEIGRIESLYRQKFGRLKRPALVSI